MIISASRRTDIPAFYSEWLINRLKAGFTYVRNPHNPNRISCVSLSPEVVDCIVFWTKNPRPMLRNLEILDEMGYPYYFQFTITPYDHRIENGLPGKTEIMETFKELSNRIGKERVIWRYDPIILSETFPMSYHLDAFSSMCDILGGYTNKCIFSFIDLYTKVQESVKGMIDHEVTSLDKKRIAQAFLKIAERHSLILETCAEAIDLSPYGIFPASCIDADTIQNSIGYPIQGKKDANQRPACGCIESIDIGAYDCCSHGCVYCYATSNHHRVRSHCKQHDPHSPLLVGQPRGDETITVREMYSYKLRQSSLF